MADGTVTGLTVPHHLLASDLIARAFRYASGASVRQVVVLSPDHFELGATRISVAEGDLSTPFGILPVDENVAAVLDALPGVESQSFFYREHGVQAVLPFVAYHFGGAKVTALAFKPSVREWELDMIVAALERLLGPQTLVVQSTDFSHGLSAEPAGRRDAETLAVLARCDPAEVLGLSQPDHLDSAAAQYVQDRLQTERFAASPLLLAHANSQDYTEETLTATTSYIVRAYVERPRPRP